MINNEDWQKSLNRLKQLVKEQPENGEAWFELATFFRDECDNPDYAVKAFENAKKYLPEQDLRLQLGSAYAKVGDFDRGIALLEQYVNEKPCAEGYVLLSLALKRANRIEAAKKTVEMAIHIEPTFEEPYLVLGQLVKETSLEMAINYFRKAIELDFEYQEAWRELGAALIHNSQTIEEGLKSLQRAISLKPDDGWAHMYLGIGYWKANRLDEADSEYRRAIEEFPDIPLFKEYYEDFCCIQGYATVRV